MIKKLLFPALVGAMTMFASCEADPCKDLDGKCGTGTCFEGTCVCDEGYEADAAGVCNVQWNTKFLGSYTGDDCGFPLTSPVVISAGATADEIKIINFGGFANIGNLTTKVGRTNSSDVSALELILNDVVDDKGRKFKGSGTISGTRIQGSYVVTYPDNTTESCTFTYNK